MRGDARPLAAASPTGLTQRELWRFFWPLTVVGLLMIGGPLAQTSVLARFPDAVRELAVFARAWGTFALFNATLVFMPQLANVLARGPEARRTCLRFAVGASLAVLAPLILVAGTGPGRTLLADLYGISGATLDQVVRYLRWLCPMILVNGLRMYHTGLLVQIRRTGTVTFLNAGHLTVLLTILITGLHRGWAPVTTVVSAQLVAGTGYLIAVVALVARLGPPGNDPAARWPDPPSEPVTTRSAFAFFWPVAVTSGLFAFSRPILYSFAGRTAEGDVLIAALKIAFDVAMLFHIPLNQFRHVFATFGRTDLVAVRRFLTRVTATTTVFAVGALASGLMRVGIERGIGASEEVVPGALRALWVLALIPASVALRNYFHGLSLTDRRTRPMALGSVFRNLAIFAAGWMLHRAGVLGYATGAAALLLGFVVEALTVAGARTGSKAAGRP